MRSNYPSDSWIFKLADEVNVGVCLADHQKSVRYLNYYHLANIWKNPRILKPGDALGQPISSVFPHPLSVECERLFDEVLTTGRWASIKEHVETYGGPPRTVEVSAAPLGYEEAAGAGVVLLSSDLADASMTDLVSQ